MILHDGDYVEADAERGVVKVLKKEERYADDLETIMRMQSEIKQSVKAEVEAEFPDISKKKKKLN